MYDCSYCGLSFSLWGSYIDHTSSNHDTKGGAGGIGGFKCRKCLKVFQKENNFKTHCEYQNPKPCTICPVVCCTRKQLEIHKRRKHPSFQCQMCKKFFSRKIKLKMHENIKRWFKTSCTECSDSFCTMKMLRLHVENVHDDRNLKPDDADSNIVSSAEVPPHDSLIKGSKTCPICSKMFYDHCNVKRHMKTEHEKAERCECKKCYKTFSNQYSLNYHIKVSHQAETFFTCPVCEVSFKTIAELYKHKKSAHNKEVKFKCRYCEKHLSSRSNLLRHKQEKHCKATRFDTSRIKVSLYAFACEQCDFVAKRKFHLLRHTKIKHETGDQNKNFIGDEKKTCLKTCQHCYKTFSKKSNLKRHVESVHETERDSNSFKDENNRTAASVSNEVIEDKKIVKKECNYCEKSFLSTNLWRHIQEVHGKTKYNTDQIIVSSFPHECEQCDFKTKRSYDLKRHYMHKHSLVEVTFPCENCTKVFNYESSLKRHSKVCQEPIPKA